VGEEKTDEVTNQYNLAMKKILPEHGIQVVEIPRKTMPKSEEPISATKVREILEKNGELTDLIPESTRKLLLQTWE
jgi:[citrate (pro-3S)-lyase] ligase